MTKWHNTPHESAAKAEGWGIYATDTDDGMSPPFEIQRSDKDAILSSDWVAHSRVLRGAEAGIPHCIAALAFISRYSLAEYEDMLERDEEDFYADYPYAPR